MIPDTWGAARWGGRSALGVTPLALATTLALAMMLMLAAPVGAQVVRAGPLDLDLTGRVQVQFNTTSVDGGELAEPPPASAFEMRRVRFGANLAYGEWITGEIEADFAGSAPRLTDGYIDLALADLVGVRAGQFNRPFGAFELESSSTGPTIERGVRIRGLERLVGVPAETQVLLDGGGYLGRQVGVMAHGAAGRLAYAAGVFNGEGANTRETAGSKAYAGRLTYAVGGARSAGATPLSLGAGVSVQPTGVLDGRSEVHGRVVALDASWGGFREPGLRARAEWMIGDNPLAAAGPDLPTMTGAHGVVAWFAPTAGRVEGYEPVLRLGWADPVTDQGGDTALLVTPGLNLYFDGRNRFMVNGDVYVPQRTGLDPVYALVAQLQVYF